MKPRRYFKPTATSKRAIHQTEAYYRMMADTTSTSDKTPPPMGFDALRKAAQGKPIDEEAQAERAAIQGDAA